MKYFDEFRSGCDQPVLGFVEGLRTNGWGDVEEAWIGAFHATCVRILWKHGTALDLKGSFVIDDDGDQVALMWHQYISNRPRTSDSAS